MESLNNVLDLMKQNCYMGSIDLKDAYYSINVHNDYRKFLRFIWNGQLFEFTCLPMGLSCSPRLFTKLLKPVFMRLRENGLILIYYLDDSWLMGITPEELTSSAQSLGLTPEVMMSSAQLLGITPEEMYQIDTVHVI